MLSNKPVTYKKIGKIDVKPFLDFLTEDINFSENNNYNRSTFFKGCKSFFIVEHGKIPDENILNKFIEVSQELIKIISLTYGKGGSNNLQYSLLSPGGKINPHVDEGEIFEESYRIHLPLVTNPDVKFIIDGKENHFKEGELVEINNQKEHCVYNNHKTESRIHLILDYTPIYKPKLRH